MAKKKVIPEYSKITKNGIEYYRTRILDADGKQVDIYGKTCEPLPGPMQKLSYEKTTQRSANTARNG